MGIDITVRAVDGSEQDVRIPAGPGSPYPLARPGAIVGAGAPPAHAGRAGLRLEVIAGPDAGREVPLAREPVTVGRGGGCTLRLTDPDVSRRHALVSNGAHGWSVQDLGSRNGTRMWRPATSAAISVGPDPVVLTVGSMLGIGDSLLRLTASEAAVASTRPGADGTLLVTAGAAPVDNAEPGLVELPTAPSGDRPQAPIGWLPALVPAAVAVAVAVWLHAPQFALFAALAPVTLLLTAGGERHRLRRARRAEHASYAHRRGVAERAVTRALAAEADARRAEHPGAPDVLRTAELPAAGLWRRRAGGGLPVRLGLGVQPARLQVRERTVTRSAGQLDTVPVVADLADGPLGVAAPPSVLAGIGRWLVAQLCVAYGPSTLQLALLLSARAEPDWRWARWLPHLAGRVAAEATAHRVLIADLAGRLSATNVATGPGTRLLLVVDRIGALAELPGLLDVLRHSRSAQVSALCLDERRNALPAACTALAIAVGETGSRLVLESRAQLASGVHLVADRVDAAWADRVARGLAPLREPAGPSSGALPDACELLELLGADCLDPAAIRARWREARRDPGGLPVVLGAGVDGALAVDLARDGPHVLVAGTTGAGKSELLRCLITSLAVGHGPDAVTFVLVDYKGGATFAECAMLPHTVGVVTDLDPVLAARALRALERELDRREHLFAGATASDLAGYLATRPAEPLPRLVIVVDEFAELAEELDSFLAGLVAIARRGRSLGVHLVLATQRPGGVVVPEIRANTALRIALRVSEPAESQDVIGTDAAAWISRRTPGRAYLRIGGGAPVALQCARLAALPAERIVPLDAWRRPAAQPPRPADALRTLIATLNTAAESQPRPRAPWLPPLPAAVPARALPSPRATAIPLAQLDLPDERAQPPLLIDLAEPAGLLVAGAPRTGRSSALQTLALSAAGRLGPEDLAVYGIDFAGGLGELSALPHCAGLLQRDPEASALLFARLAEQVARSATLPDARVRLLLVDGWEAFADASDEFDAGQSVRALQALARAGPSAGLTVAVAGGRGALTSRLASDLGTRLVLRLADPADYPLVGLPPVPAATLGAGRCRRADDGVLAQLAHLGTAPGAGGAAEALARVRARWADHTPPGDAVRVRSLPGQVALAELAPVRGRLVLGVGADAAELLSVDLSAGQGRLLVAGPPRSGRSTLIRSLLQQLVAAGRAPLLAAPKRSPAADEARLLGVRVVAPSDAADTVVTVDTAADARPDVVLVDDSEAFLDTPVGDALVELARAHGSSLPVVVTGGSDELAICFRGIGAEARRSRCAVLLAPRPVDGELAGVRLPAQRGDPLPGRGVVVGDPAWGPPFTRGPVRVQLALPRGVDPGADARGQPMCG